MGTATRPFARMKIAIILFATLVALAAAQELEPAAEASDATSGKQLVEDFLGDAIEQDVQTESTWGRHNRRRRATSTYNRLPAGSNKNPPAGYMPKPGSGKCRCRGSGHGLDSCGELCCAASPYTDPSTSTSVKYSYKNGGRRSTSNFCYQRRPAMTRGSNQAPPAGYKAKRGSGKCRCRGSGFGLDSCGTLCCAASPFTAPNSDSIHYYKKGGSRSTSNFCYEPINYSGEELEELEDSRKDAEEDVQTESPWGRHNRRRRATSTYNRLPAGSNKKPPAGYMPKRGSGKCRCRGSGHGLDSCGELCCAASPYTDPSTSTSVKYSYKNGGRRSTSNFCYQRRPAMTRGSNQAPPAGYKAKRGSGKCRCRGSGFGLDSCGTLCCAASPFTAPNSDSIHYYKKGGSRSTSNFCYEPIKY